MTKAEEIANKVSRDFQKLNQLVRGNGVLKGSMLGRLDGLEEDFKIILERLEALQNSVCKEPCNFKVWKEKEEDMKDKKRTFRIGDVANYIQLVVMILLLYGMFIK